MRLHVLKYRALQSENESNNDVYKVATEMLEEIYIKLEQVFRRNIFRLSKMMMLGDYNSIIYSPSHPNLVIRKHIDQGRFCRSKGSRNSTWTWIFPQTTEFSNDFIGFIIRRMAYESCVGAGLILKT